MVIMLDAHVHTNSSPDSSLTIKQLLEEMRAKGLNAVAVTDHDTMEGFRRVRHSSAFKDLLVIPGVEISTDQGDLIILGLEDPPLGLRDAGQVIEAAHAVGGLVVAPHPFDTRRPSLGERCGMLKVDAIEIANGKCHREENSQAKGIAKVLGLPGIGGSDAHRKEDVGAVINILNCRSDVGSVLDALRKGEGGVRTGIGGGIRKGGGSRTYM